MAGQPASRYRISVILGIRHVVDDVHRRRVAVGLTVLVRQHHREVFKQAVLAAPLYRFSIVPRVAVAHHPGQQVVA